MSDAHPQVSIILPTYNEAGNITELIERAFKAIGNDGEIVVVDDDSPDGTWSIVDKMTIKYNRLRLIRRTGRRGLTSAIQEGIDASRGELIGWMDSDLSMPPEALAKLVYATRTGSDIAVGSRYVPGGADLRHERLAVTLSLIISYLCRFILSRSIRDYTSGFIVAKREVFDQIKLKGDHGEYFIDLIYRAIRKGFSVKEIPYKLISRIHGTSKTAPSSFGFAKRGRKYLATLIRLRTLG